MFCSSRARLVPGSVSSDLAGRAASALIVRSAVKTYRMDVLQLYGLTSQQHAGELVPASVRVFPGDWPRRGTELRKSHQMVVPAGLAARLQNANTRPSWVSDGKPGQESPERATRERTSWRGKPGAIRMMPT